MASRTTSIKITGNPTEAIAALDKLGIKAEAVGKETESAMAKAARGTGGVFGKLGAQLGNWGIPFSESISRIGEKFADVEGKGKHFGGAFAEIGKASVLGLGGAATAIGAVGLEAAIAGQKVEAQLKNAVVNAGGSFEEFEPKMRAADAAMRKFGFTNEDTNAALATLTTSLGSPEKALGAYQVAANLARQKNMDLNSAALMVAKGMEGQTRPLKALGIDLPVYAGNAQAVKLAQMAMAKAQEHVNAALAKQNQAQAKVNAILAKTPGAVDPASKAHKAYQAALNGVATAHGAYEKALEAAKAAQVKMHAVQSSGPTILKALEQRTKGAADAYGKTFAGQVAQGKAQLNNLAEKIGVALLPKLTALMSATEKVVNWFSKHKDIAMLLAGIVGGVLVAATVAWTISLFAAGGALAFVMSPITLIIGAIALLAFGIYELVKHWKAVWSAIKSALGDAWAFIKQHFTLIMTVAFGPLGLVIAELAKHWKQIWNDIKAALSDAWGFLKSVFGFIVNLGIHYVRDEINAFKTVWGAVWTAIKTAFSTAWDGIKGIFGFFKTLGTDVLTTAINGFSTAWNTVWNGVKTVIQDVWNFVQPIINTMSGAISGVMGAVGKVAGIAGKIGHGVGGALGALGLASGGWTQGAPGQVSPNYVHGGEYVLSTGMLSGTQAIDPTVVGAVAKQNSNGAAQPAAFGGGSTTTINNYLTAETNASPSAIAGELVYAMRPFVNGG